MTDLIAGRIGAEPRLGGEAQVVRSPHDGHEVARVPRGDADAVDAAAEIAGHPGAGGERAEGHSED